MLGRGTRRWGESEILARHGAPPALCISMPRTSTNTARVVVVCFNASHAAAAAGVEAEAVSRRRRQLDATSASTHEHRAHVEAVFRSLRTSPHRQYALSQQFYETDRPGFVRGYSLMVYRRSRRRWHGRQRSGRMGPRPPRGTLPSLRTQRRGIASCEELPRSHRASSIPAQLLHGIPSAASPIDCRNTRSCLPRRGVGPAVLEAAAPADLDSVASQFAYIL